MNPSTLHSSSEAPATATQGNVAVQTSTMNTTIPILNTEQDVEKLLTDCHASFTHFVKSLADDWENNPDDKSLAKIPPEWTCADEPLLQSSTLKYGIPLTEEQLMKESKVKPTWGTLNVNDNKFIQASVAFLPPCSDSAIESLPKLEIGYAVPDALKPHQIFETYSTGNMVNIYTVAYVADPKLLGTIAKGSEAQEDEVPESLGWLVPGEAVIDRGALTPTHFSEALAGTCFSVLHNKALGKASPSCFLKLRLNTQQDAYVNFTEGWVNVAVSKPRTVDPPTGSTVTMDKN